MNKKLLILTLAMLTSGVVYGAKKDNKGKKPLTAQQLQKAQADPLKEQKRAFMRKVASDMFPGQDNKIEALTSTCDHFTNREIIKATCEAAELTGEDFLMFASRLTKSIKKPEFKKILKDKIGCNNCGNTEENIEKKLLACSGCKTAYYCDSACQKEHWKAHKKICSDLLKFRTTREGK